MPEPITVTLLLRLPSGAIYEVGTLDLDPADPRDGIADVLEQAAAEIRADGTA